MHNIFYFFAVLCIIFLLYRSRSGFDRKPDSSLINHYANQLCANITPLSTYLDVKRKLPWLDPITYEDARILAINNSLTYSNAKMLFI